MAYAARKRGLALTVFASKNANPLKIARMRALGADVQLADDADAAHAAAEAFATQHRALLVTDGRDPAIGEGAGTIGVELLRWPDPFDAILAPVGDGSLLAGVARWGKAHHPATQMIGVGARGAPAMERSWRAGRGVELERAGTIPDGLWSKEPYPEGPARFTRPGGGMLL